MSMTALNAFLCGRARCERREDFRSAVSLSTCHGSLSRRSSREREAPEHQGVCNRSRGSGYGVLLQPPVFAEVLFRVFAMPVCCSAAFARFSFFALLHTSQYLEVYFQPVAIVALQSGAVARFSKIGLLQFRKHGGMRVLTQQQCQPLS